MGGLRGALLGLMVAQATGFAPRRPARGWGALKSSVIRASTVDEDAPSTEALQPKPGRSFLKARATGVGAAAPDQIVTNNDIAAMGLDTSDEWISTRTGISQRHVLDSATPLKSMATAAALQALEDAGVPGEDVDLVIVATSSPDDLFGDATSVAHAIGASKAVAFDLTAACSGFLFALVTGSQFLHAGTYKKAVIVGADALTRWVDWDDRNVCILFGDGAGAVVLESSGDAEVGAADGPGILGFELHSDGGGQSKLCLPYAGLTRPIGDGGKQEVTTGAYAPITMEGKDVSRTHAQTRVPLSDIDFRFLTTHAPPDQCRCTPSQRGRYRRF
jgi:3-oxoacyl-[acyl-carrier-protein] synthase-3